MKRVLALHGFEPRSYLADQEAKPPQMRLSVIIPTFNRPERLARCLSSLAGQRADPSLWEVVVVNDGGLDVSGTVQSVDAGFPIFLVNQENKGPASARNLGVERSRGSLLAFLDDDCMAEPDWVSMAMASACPGELIGGKVTNLLSDNVFSETSQTLIDFLYESFEGTSDMFFTTNNMCMHSEDFHRLGGFDTSFTTSAGEDREFCVRASHSGLRLRLVPGLRIGHVHELRLGSFLALHFKYGRAASTYRVSLGRNRIGGGGRPRMGFYMSMLLHPYRKGLSRPLAQSALLAASQTCTATGFLYERIVTRR